MLIRGQATKKYPDGSIEVEDNAQKWMHFNTFSTIAVAGDAGLGVYIAKYMAELSDEQTSFVETKQFFDDYLEDASIKFNQLTGRYTQCAILLVGYDLTRTDDFDAVRLGEVMGAGVQRRGDGVQVSQSIDPEILQALTATIESSATPVGRGVRVNIPSSRAVVIGYKVIIQGSGVQVTTEEADNFEAIFYGMDAVYNKIEIPVNTLSDIYFRDASNMDGFQILSLDTVQLINFYNDVITERAYTGVGGNIFPVMMTDAGGMFYANELIGYNIHDGSETRLRESKMIDGKLHYLDVNGRYKPYKGLLDIAAELEGAAYDLGFELEY